MSSAEAGQAVPPQNLDAEEHVLGACMLAQKAIDAAGEEISPEDFYRGSHGKIFRAVLDLYAAGRPVDPITLAEELERRGELDEAGGRARVNELAALVPATSNARHYARIVREMATLRGLARVGQEVVRLARERDGMDAAELVDRAEAAIFDLVRRREASGFSLPIDLLPGTFSRLSDLQGKGGGVIGLPTGLSDLDRKISGLQRGNLVIVGARPSVGKSAQALGIAANAAVGLGLPVAFFTLEMNREEVMHRLLALEARVDLHKLRTGRLGMEEWGRMADAANRVQNAPIHIDDSGAPTVLEIRSRARQLRARNPDLALVVVDYLQLVAQDAESRVQEISRISRALKVLAGELELPVLALSQLSRQVEQRHDKRPMLSDLRESGSIEADADVVLLLYRDEIYSPEETDQAGIAEVNVAKQRNGPTGVVKVHFDKRSARFANLGREP